MRDGLVAGAVAGVLSGAPSTLHALVTGGDVLEASRAAGTLLDSDENWSDESSNGPRLLAAAAVGHTALSLGWGTALALALPRRHTVMWGALAGLGVAALDLGVGARRFPRIRALPLGPQVADHVAFGAVAGAVLSARR